MSTGGGFINVFNRSKTGFHGQAKLFDQNFFRRKNFPSDGETASQFGT